MSAPVGLKAAAGDSTAALSWNAVPGAASYSVYRATASGAEVLLTSGLTTPSYADTGLTNGTAYFYKVTAVSGAGESAKSAEVSATPQAAQASTSASFAGADVATQGNWKGVYGADGYSLSQDPSAGNPALPAYAAVSLSGPTAPNGGYTWAASTTDPRGLLKAVPGTLDRLGACWYSRGTSNDFDVDVNLTDGQAHRVSLYCLDWDQRGRVDAITVRDAATGAALDAQTAGAAATGGGTYLTWAVRGHVVFHVASGNSYNAVLSALFFGPSR